MQTRRIRLILAISLLSPSAYCASAVDMHISAQGVEQALNQFVVQSGYQVLYPADIAQSGFRSPAVSGSLNPEVALEMLLSGSGMTYEFVNDRTIAIRTPERAQLTHGLLVEDDEPTGGFQSPSAPQRPAPAYSGVPEVLIEASRSFNADIERTQDDVLPYVVIDRAAIERSAASNIDDLLKTTLTMRYGPTSRNQFGLEGSGNQSSVALRGLGNAETLILIDGRRLSQRPSSNGSLEQGDLNGIPLSAVERIEVLPASASGIYGGNATGGVVNIVLKRNFSQITPTLTYENAARNDGRLVQASLVGGSGFNRGRTNVLFTIAYSDSQATEIGDRAFAQDYLRRAFDNLRNGGSASGLFAVPSGATPNISSVPEPDFDYLAETGQFRYIVPDLILKTGQSLGETNTFVPAGYSGAASDAGAALLANAGHFNPILADSAQAGGLRTSLLGGTTVKSASTSLKEDISQRTQLFVDLSVSRNESEFNYASATGVFTLPSSAPTNPFAQDVRVYAPLQKLDSTNYTRSDLIRVLGGIIQKLPGDWNSEIDYTYERSNFRQTLAPSDYRDALTSAIVSGELDLLRDTATRGNDLASYLLPPTQIAPTRSTQKDVALRLAGPIGSLPGGRPIVSTLVELVDQEFSPYQSTLTLSSGDLFVSSFSSQRSKSKSIYTEVRLPLVTGANARRAVNTLELQVSARYDDYEMAGGHPTDISGDDGIARAEREFKSVNPTLGLKYEPLDWLALRASAGTGFLPPPLGLLQPSEPALLPGFFFPYTDPRRGNEPLGDVLYRGGGNQELSPEKSKSWSAGVIFKPRTLAGFRLSLDWVRIRKSDNITQLFLDQQTIDNEALLPADTFTRAPKSSAESFEVGPITGFNGASLNGTHSVSESYDFALDYSFVGGKWGEWEISAVATRLMHSAEQVVIALPLDERAGTARAPKWNANATVGWRKGPIGLGWVAYYLDSIWVLDSHDVSPTQGSASIDSTVYHDLYGTYLFNERAGLLAELELRAGVKNVFDQRPRFAALQSNFYDNRMSPTLMTYYLTISKAF